MSFLRRRRARHPRVLLVPDQWSGSVQEYYHFILGYLATVTLWLDRHPGVPVSVRDCGPMNHWFDLLPGHPDLTIMSPGDMLHLVARGDRKTVVLRGLDDPTSFDSARLIRFRELLLRGAVLPSATAGVTVIDRLSSGEFNATAAAEVPASGQAVRSTPNLSSAARSILEAQPGVDFAIVDAAQLAPADQLSLFASTHVLVAQHGAGLANMIWMPPGGAVVEILPPLPEYVSPIFGNLARALGHAHVIVPQNHDHADVDAELLAGAIASALAHAGVA